MSSQRRTAGLINSICSSLAMAMVVGLAGPSLATEAAASPEAAAPSASDADSHQRLAKRKKKKKKKKKSKAKFGAAEVAPLLDQHVEMKVKSGKKTKTYVGVLTALTGKTVKVTPDGKKKAVKVKLSKIVSLEAAPLDNEEEEGEEEEEEAEEEEEEAEETAEDDDEKTAKSSGKKEEPALVGKGKKKAEGFLDKALDVVEKEALGALDGEEGKKGSYEKDLERDASDNYSLGLEEGVAAAEGETNFLWTGAGCVLGGCIPACLAGGAWAFFGPSTPPAVGDRAVEYRSGFQEGYEGEAKWNRTTAFLIGALLPGIIGLVLGVVGGAGGYGGFLLYNAVFNPPDDRVPG